jgi:nicotinate-nucleotide adenylyltransferase
MRSRAGGEVPRVGDVRRLGIFGGTFDPVHCGHLICAEQLREAIDLDLVLFVPSSSPPHKYERPEASAAHRLEMVKLAIAGSDRFATSDIEVVKGGVSYTVDTVRHIRDVYGEGVQLWLLMGMDAYLDIPTWKEPETIAAECSFGVATRPGYSKDLDPRLPKAKTRFVDITLVEISSTDIRRRLSRGKSIKHLVPDGVERYIRQHGPYPSASKGQED